MKRHLDILLVDDDRNECSLFGVAVDKADLNICLQTVMDGEQAIDYLTGRGVYANRSVYPSPALLVLDLDMPLTGWLEFLDWRRSSSLFSSLPVVLFSAFAYRGTIETALAMGANAFVAKPLEFECWESAIRQIWEFGAESSEQVNPTFAVGGG
jgi:CheY-like chemotaxis protein